MKDNAFLFQAKNIFSPIKIVLLVILTFFIMSFIKPVFSTSGNILNILTNVSIEGIIAIGMTYVIIVQEIDLSVGAIMSMGCVFAVYFQVYGVAAGCLASIVVCTFCGFINGFVITKFKLPSMGVTLAMSVILDGLILVITRRQSINGINENFWILSSYLIFGIPIIIFIFFLLVTLFEFILLRTSYGRNIYACGGNLTASGYAGINVNFTKTMAFVITGGLAGLAGALMVARYNAAGAIIGTNTPFFIITAVMLGGTSLNGGEGRIVNTFQGMLFIGTLDSLLNFYNKGTGYRNIFVGAILIIMVIVDSIMTRRRYFK
jgi:ribose/xylose/arabinose/galactoside ABC-type transport system permease subunit